MNHAHDNPLQPHDTDDNHTRHPNDEAMLWRRLMEVAESEAAKVEGKWKTVEEWQ